MENGLRRDHFHGTRVVSSDGCQIKHLSADRDIDVVRVVLERVAIQLRSVEDVLRGTDDGRDEDDDEDDDDFALDLQQWNEVDAFEDFIASQDEESLSRDVCTFLVSLSVRKLMDLFACRRKRNAHP